jgi:hypothetical protein
MASLAHKFPVNTQVFSRRLSKQLRHALSIIGLDLCIDHREDGSHCSLKMRRPLFTPEPDAICVNSSASVNNGNGRQNGQLGTTDGTDVRRSPPPNKEEQLEEILSKIRSVREDQP